MVCEINAFHLLSEDSISMLCKAYLYINIVLLSQADMTWHNRQWEYKQAGTPVDDYDYDDYDDRENAADWNEV